MRGLACLQAGALLGRRASGLGEPDRLVLEEHLARCEKCREDARLLDGMVETVSTSLPSLSQRVRERALARALASPPPGELATPPQVGWRPAVVIAGLVAGAALVLVVVLGGGRRPPHPTAAATTDILVAGDLTSVARTIRAGDVVPAEAPLTTRAGARLRLGRATVEVAAPGAVTWQPSIDTVRLGAGRLRAVVEPVAGAHFRVATERFHVEVTGTEFEVDLDGVRVVAGTVRVLDAAAVQVLANVGPGQAWSVAPVPAAAPASRLVVAPDASSPSAPTGRVAAPGAVGPGAAVLLEKARAQLAARDVAAARRTVGQALALAAGRRERAEAETLLAECALVAGDEVKAAQLYAAVARRHADLPAGETALFAAARLKARAGPAGEASKLLREYLARYPTGRFRTEATARLRALGDRGP